MINNRLSRLAILVAVLLSGGCTAYPVPADCVRHGVLVQPSDTITGTIIAEHYKPKEIVQRKCMRATGCVRAVGFEDYVFITPKGEYEIWYSDPSILIHERCHALYEEPRHTE